MALWAKIPYRDYAFMTPEEVIMVANAEQEKQTEFIRMLAWLIYNNAALTVVGFNDPKKFPSLEDAFPSLFEKKQQQDWWVMKQRVEDYKASKIRDFDL